MRPDVGLSTLPQRLAGLTTLHRQPVQPGGQGQGSFAATLAQQVQAQTAAPAPAYSAAAAGMAGAQAVGLLGRGTSLHHGPSVIRPQLPTDPALPSDLSQDDLALHDDHDHDHFHAPGALTLDRSGPPAELQAHGNGTIPAAALEPLGVGDHRMWAPAARAFRDLQAAATRDGVVIGVNSSYRDIATQHQMVERYGLYSQGGRAAEPGTSNHGWGVSLDLDLDPAAQAWMREHAEDYGFAEDVPREPWHWTFKASGY